MTMASARSVEILLPVIMMWNNHPKQSINKHHICLPGLYQPWDELVDKYCSENKLGTLGIYLVLCCTFFLMTPINNDLCKQFGDMAVLGPFTPATAN